MNCQKLQSDLALKSFNESSDRINRKKVEFRNIINTNKIVFAVQIILIFEKKKNTLTVLKEITCLSEL